MRVFITGATGFVGRNLVPRILKEGHDIICLMRNPEQHVKSEIYKKCRIIKGDVTKRESVRGLLKDVEVLIHLAVATPLTVDQKNQGTYYMTNVVGTENILNECIESQINRILCFSSTAAIGRHKRAVIDESTPLRPINEYGKSKKEADNIISSYIDKYNLPILTICFPHIYGPGDTHEFLKIVKMIKKGVMPQVGFSPNLLPSVFLDDAIDAIMLALSKGKIGEKYIIADDDPHDLRDIRRIVLENLGIKRGFYPFIPKSIGLFGAFLLEFSYKIMGRESHVKVENIKSILSGRHLSIKKAKTDLGFEPKIALNDGIRKTIEWYKREDLI